MQLFRKKSGDEVKEGDTSDALVKAPSGIEMAELGKQPGEAESPDTNDGNPEEDTQSVASKATSTEIPVKTDLSRIWNIWYRDRLLGGVAWRDKPRKKGDVLDEDGGEAEVDGELEAEAVLPRRGLQGCSGDCWKVWLRNEALGWMDDDLHGSWFVDELVLLSWRVLVNLWILAMMVSQGYKNFFNAPWLTHITWVLSWYYFVYLGITGIHNFSVFHYEPRSYFGGRTWYYLALKFIHVVNAQVVVPLVIVVCLFYWILLYDDTDGASVFNIHVHGMVGVWVLIDTCLSKNRVYLTHIIFMLLFNVLYTIISGIYQAADGDALYSVIDWTKPYGAPVILFTFVLVLALHVGNWAILLTRDFIGLLHGVMARRCNKCQRDRKRRKEAKKAAKKAAKEERKRAAAAQTEVTPTASAEA